MTPPEEIGDRILPSHRRFGRVRGRLRRAPTPQQPVQHRLPVPPRDWVHGWSARSASTRWVLYLLMTAGLTIGILVWVARRMEMRPNRVQTAVEWAYDLTKRLTNDNMDERMARKWFPLVFTLFVFVLVTNLLGYVPLPVNTIDKINVAGTHLPSFQIYAADTNVALPLVLAIGVFIAYNVEGFRHHGFIGYLKSLIPSGVAGGMVLFLFPLEIISHFLRLLSLAIRLWANLLVVLP